VIDTSPEKYFSGIVSMNPEISALPTGREGSAGAAKVGRPQISNLPALISKGQILQMKPKWQKTFRKTPDSIVNKAARLGNEIVVAAVKRISGADLAAGVYQHLGMTLINGEPRFSERVMPNTETGRFSLWNAQGQEVIRKDLPMVPKTFTFEAPNYGDWSHGSHEVSWGRDVYQREFIPPAEDELSVTLLRSEPGADPQFVFRFRVERILDRRAEDFAAELFAAVNLLQENVGAADVFTGDADQSEYLKTISVEWEILPPGERTEILNRILSKFRNPSVELKQKLLARYALLEKLKPIAYVSGTSGFQRYFGAQFRDDLVVFENLEYGNAIYVMFENWEELSKLSRIDLLRNRHHGFERIVHRAGWEQILISLLRQRRAA
jgi:hypothetical protein